MTIPRSQVYFPLPPIFLPPLFFIFKRSFIHLVLSGNRLVASLSAGESIYMLPSDMKLKIKTGTIITVGYNNKILVSDGKFILGKNEKVNSLETAAMKSHKTQTM